MTVGMVEIMIAFSVLLQWASGEKSRRKVSIYKYSNSCTVIGGFALDNKYRILTLNCGSLFIVFAKACYVRPPHRKIHIEKQRRIFSQGEGCMLLTRLILVKAEEKLIRHFSGVAWPEQRPLSTYW